jgi:hypothetical protein
LAATSTDTSQPVILRRALRGAMSMAEAMADDYRRVWKVSTLVAPDRGRGVLQLTAATDLLSTSRRPHMHRKLLTIGTTAAVAAAALAPGAGAADPPTPTLKDTGAYLYLDHDGASKQNFVRVVFRTASALPRRYDGSIQAGASIDGVAHSIGSAKKGATIYTGASEVKGGSVPSWDGSKLTRKAAKVGRSFSVLISTRDGQKVTRNLVLRAERPGDDTGKPLTY